MENTIKNLLYSPLRLKVFNTEILKLNPIAEIHLGMKEILFEASKLNGISLEKIFTADRFANFRIIVPGTKKIPRILDRNKIGVKNKSKYKDPDNPKLINKENTPKATKPTIRPIKKPIKNTIYTSVK